MSDPNKLAAIFFGGMAVTSAVFWLLIRFLPGTPKEQNPDETRDSDT